MPDQDYEILDDRFGSLIKQTASVEMLYTGCRWAEGPAWFAAGRYLVWSDIPNDRMMRWDETSGQTSVFRQPAGYTNGHTVDRQGRLVSCEHGGRRVTRTEHDGSITILADAYDGKKLNSPNDVVVKSDGSIWFTDPAYGIDSDYEGHKGENEIGGCYVFLIDPDSGEIEAVITDLIRPNGIAFSPDESLLYVADTGASRPKPMYVYDIDASDRPVNGRLFATCTSGGFDGFRLDTEGRIWTSAGDGVHCYDPDGTLLGKVLVPEVVANVEWGGAKLNRLFICGTSSLYSVLLPVNGDKRV